METLGKRRALGAVLLALALAACGNPDSHEPAQPGCSAGAAGIGVTDGMVSILCGCNEGGGAWVANSANLQCTVAAGTVVAFHFINPLGRVQIVSAPNSAKSFTPSPVFNPEEDPIWAHAVRLDEAGTYTFTDSFNSSLSASIVVTP